MLTYDELKEAIDAGYITGKSVKIVRKNGHVFDYVLPGEKVGPHEDVTLENLDDVLKEIENY